MVYRPVTRQVVHDRPDGHLPPAPTPPNTQLLALVDPRLAHSTMLKQINSQAFDQ